MEFFSMKMGIFGALTQLGILVLDPLGEHVSDYHIKTVFKADDFTLALIISIQTQHVFWRSKRLQHSKAP